MVKKKIIAAVLVMVLIIVFSLGACKKNANKPADWNSLYAEAAGWGYDGSLDDFINILLCANGDKDDKGNGKLKAYEIYKKYNPCYTGEEEQWIDDLINGRLVLTTSEWNKIIDDTVYEFNKKNANLRFYCDSEGTLFIVDNKNTIHIGDNIILLIPPKLWLYNDIAYYGNSPSRLSGSYYFFEEESFCMYKTDEYVVLGHRQDGKSLFEHMMKYIPDGYERQMYESINILSDTKERFNVFKIGEDGYRFETKKGDGFSIWDIGPFEWEMDGRTTKSPILGCDRNKSIKVRYSIPKLTGVAKVENGKISSISFYFNEKEGFGMYYKEIHWSMEMIFDYREFSFALPAIDK